jgi:hypothetical protein
LEPAAGFYPLACVLAESKDGDSISTTVKGLAILTTPPAGLCPYTPRQGITPGPVFPGFPMSKVS